MVDDTIAPSSLYFVCYNFFYYYFHILSSLRRTSTDFNPIRCVRMQKKERMNETEKKTFGHIEPAYNKSNNTKKQVLFRWHIYICIICLCPIFYLCALIIHLNSYYVRKKRDTHKLWMVREFEKEENNNIVYYADLSLSFAIDIEIIKLNLLICTHNI